MEQTASTQTRTTIGQGIAPYAGPLSVAGMALVALIAARYGTQGDLSHMWEPTRAVADLRFGEIYPPGTPGTSMTGWIALVLAPYMATRGWLGDVEGFTFAGLLALPLVLLSVRYTMRALWPTCSVALAWLVGFMALILPTTWAVWVNYYHPQDLAAVGLVVFGIGLAAKQRWGWAGVVLGVAVMTRQWAILAALPMAGLSGKNIWKFALGGAATCAALLAPLVLMGGNEDWFTALSASDARSTGNTLFGKFRLDMEIGAARQGPEGSNSNWFSLLTRVLPVLLAAGLGLLAFFRKLGPASSIPAASLLVPLATSGLALRMVFEGSDYPYYWAPFGILVLLMVPYAKQAWYAAIAIGTFPWLVEWLLPERFVDVQRYSRISLVLLYALIVVITPWLLLWVGRDSEASSVLPEATNDANVETGVIDANPNHVRVAWLASGACCLVALGLLLTSVVPLGAAQQFQTRRGVDRVTQEQMSETLKQQEDEKTRGGPGQSLGSAAP